MALEEKKGTIVFIIVLVTYIISGLLVGLFTDNRLISLIFKLVAVGILLFIWKDWFSFKLKFDWLSVLTGILIAVLWIGLDGLYPLIEPANAVAYTLPETILKFIVGIMIAPLVEEFFTRFFLHRYIQSNNWLKVKQGTYAFTPFIVTVLFFGLSHNEWLAGIITGILLNILWYKKKDMNSVVLSHAVANLVLGIIVVAFGMWQFW